MKFLFNLIFNRSVDSILSSINSKIEALRDLASREEVRAKDKMIEASKANFEAACCQAEARRAVNVADKLNALVS